MSGALAAAKKRRAPPENLVKPNSQQGQQGQQAPAGLTLPQVIAVIDKRLTTLEVFARESKSAPTMIPQNVQQANSSGFSEEDREEYENRFNILAEEFADLKTTIMGLQSYVMSVTTTFMAAKSASKSASESASESADELETPPIEMVESITSPNHVLFTLSAESI